jgi:hypothetical protein
MDNIESDYQIRKIGNSVFQIGDINYSFSKIHTIASILDSGLKYIPCFHFSKKDIFYNILYNMKDEFHKFNSKLFFKSKQNADVNQLTLTSEPLFNPNCNNLDCIIDKLKRHKVKQFDFLKSSMNFFYYIISNLPNNLNFVNPNLSNSQFSEMRNFKKYKPFRILDSDKNVGSVIMSHSTADELALKHLNDDKTYLKLSDNPTSVFKNKIDCTLSFLFVSKHISEKLYKTFRPSSDSRLGKFRILVKLHKPKLGIRPIVNFRNNPMEKFSKFLDFLLGPIVKNTESFIQDSQHLLQDCESMSFSENIVLYSCDFESLYTNLDLNLVMQILMDTFQDKLDTNHIDKFAFFILLELLLYNSMFSYNDQFYKQLVGLGMGLDPAPKIAHVVLYRLERKWLLTHRHIVLFYRRFIDDIFMITLFKLDEKEFVSIFLNLKLNINYGNCVQFLDLMIRFDSIFGKLSFSLFIKPTNTFAYLQVNSNHPSFIFKNIPKSMFLRVRRNCSNLSDYFYFCRLFFTHLLQKGYDAISMNRLIFYIANVPRSSLLPYKKKNFPSSKFSSDTNSIWFTTKFNYNYNLDSLLNSSFQNLQSNNQIYSNLKLSTPKSVDNNLRMFFVFDTKLAFCIKKFPCIPCNCKFCTFKSNIDYFNFQNGLSLPLLSDNSCLSVNCIYVLKCNLCNVFYIGETKDFKSRLRNHFKCIKNFKKFSLDKNEVSFHFSTLSHSIENLNWFIFKSNIHENNLRKSFEQQLIKIFQCCKNTIINEKIYFPHCDKLVLFD